MKTTREPATLLRKGLLRLRVQIKVGPRLHTRNRRQREKADNDLDRLFEEKNMLPMYCEVAIGLA